jgi:putative ABC transport system permease protein
LPWGTLFFRLMLRPLRREPLRMSLTILAVALGVAVVLAIELAGEAAAGSFRSSVETLTGSADFEITSTGGVPPEALTGLAMLPEPLRLQARVESFAVIPSLRRTVPFLGVDLLADSLPSDAGPGSSQTLEDLKRGDSVWVGQDLPFQAGDAIELLLNDRSSTFTVCGVLGDRSGEVLVMDLAPALRALGRRADMLDRILVQTPSDRPLEQWEASLRKALPDGVTIARQGSKTAANRRMLAAFRWNLRVLSYVAAVVGAFLIYNTVSLSVVRRRTEIGILRALGASRPGVLVAFLGEAACLGLAGAIAGIALGRLLAGSAVLLVARTVESLYITSRPAPVSVSWQTIVLALVLGIGVALLAALAPALEAARVAPVEAMARGRGEHQVRVHAFREAAIAIGLALLAWILARQEPIAGVPVFGYGAAVLMIAAAALAVPALVTAVTAASAGLLCRLLGVEALLAARGLAASMRRSSVLVAALSTAIAMMVAVGLMVGSFRETVIVWLNDQLRADLYLRPAGSSGADRFTTLSPDVPEMIGNIEGIEAIDRFRAYPITYEGLPAMLGGSDAEVAGRYGHRSFLSGADPRKIATQMVGQDAVIVSEPFASKHRVKAGDTLILPLGGKRACLRVIDVYYDYSSERGNVIMDRATLLRYLPDPAPSSVAIYLRPGIGLDPARRAIDQALAGRKVLLFSNRSLRAEAVRIFDRTFAITYGLEAIAVLVAVMGIAGALLMLVIDRRRELGLLRFLGGAARQVKRLVLFEAGLIGVLAIFAGFLLGLLLSLLLIYVINKQSFGWTIQFHWPVGVLTGALSAIYLATVIAGLYPARMAARLDPLAVIHEE